MLGCCDAESLSGRDVWVKCMRERWKDEKGGYGGITNCVPVFSCTCGWEKFAGIEKAIDYKNNTPPRFDQDLQGVIPPRFR